MIRWRNHFDPTLEVGGLILNHESALVTNEFSLISEEAFERLFFVLKFKENRLKGLLCTFQ